MLHYHRYTLPNGLRLLVHEDHSTPMAAVAVQYDVGSRDEDPARTGFAHLFEHLMFGGSANAPSYDDPLQLAGGENNAFTNTDLTCFYVSLPAPNLETALWLEADRMAQLTINEHALEVQRRVVVEEFKETCLNEPYGDAWHHLSALAYRRHPYRWPTIGLEPAHIEEASLDDVRAFYGRHYHPGNAILAVAGAVRAEAVYRQVLRLFGELPARQTPERSLTTEPDFLPAGGSPTDGDSPPPPRKVYARVAVDAVYLAYPMPGRVAEDFFALDLLTDVLAEGASSRLYRTLVKERGLATTIDAYVTGTADPGLVVVEGKPRDGVTCEQLHAAIEEQLAALRETPVPAIELEKVKNKLASSMAFSELSVTNKAINLCFYAGIGDVELINTEEDIYQALTPAQLQAAAARYFGPAQCRALYYRSSGEGGERLPLALAGELAE